MVAGIMTELHSNVVFEWQRIFTGAWRRREYFSDRFGALFSR
jgi:hypothetical protein